MPEIGILYADGDLIAVNKPAGMLSESSPAGDGLPDRLAADLRADGQPDLLYPVHRLDRGTSGVLLLARTPAAAAKLSADLAARRMEKEYLAVIHGVPEPPSGEMTDLLFHDRAKNRSYVVNRMRRGVKDARLDYRTLACADLPDGGKLSLISVILHTGRTHQIRVQFASRRLPLWGDNRYGLREKGGIALFCRRIAFTHPATGLSVEIAAPLPDGFPWRLFSENP